MRLHLPVQYIDCINSSSNIIAFRRSKHVDMANSQEWLSYAEPDPEFAQVGCIPQTYVASDTAQFDNTSLHKRLEVLLTWERSQISPACEILGSHQSSNQDIADNVLPGERSFPMPKQTLALEGVSFPRSRRPTIKSV